MESRYNERDLDAFNLHFSSDRGSPLDCVDDPQRGQMNLFHLEFRIPGEPEYINKVFTWNRHKRNRIKKQWHDVVAWTTLGKRPKKPLNKAYLKFVLYNVRNLDWDSAVSSLKPIADGLVHAGIIRNDSYVVTGPWDVTQGHCKKGQESVLISVTEKK